MAYRHSYSHRYSWALGGAAFALGGAVLFPTSLGFRTQWVPSPRKYSSRSAKGWLESGRGVDKAERQKRKRASCSVCSCESPLPKQTQAADDDAYPFKRIDSKDPLVRAFNVRAAPKTAKIVHFVRHAQGTHNVADDGGKSLRHWDARLTDKGVQQCLVFRNSSTAPVVECIVVSPTSRTLGTADLLFQEAISSGVPCCAEEAWRETVNYCCDARRTVSELRKDFPYVDFSHLAHESDPIWEYYAKRFGNHTEFTGHRETNDHQHLHQRIRQGIAALARRPEKHIAVVAHNAVLMHLFSVYSNSGIVDFADPTVSSFLQEPFLNCEMRSVALDFVAFDESRRSRL